MTAQQLKLKSRIIERGNKYHIALSWYTSDGSRKRTTVATGVIVNGFQKGHKKEFMAALEAQRKAVESEWESKLLAEALFKEKPDALADKILFSDWLLKWLDHMILDGNDGKKLSGTTLYNYGNVIRNSINPYFQERHVMLSGVNKDSLTEFYTFKKNHDGVSENTVKHYHANISKALNYAVEKKLIEKNPAAGFRFSKKKPAHNIFNEAQVFQLAQYVRGTDLEAPIFIASTFGLRRGEILGIKWDAIDFEHGILYVRGELLEYDENGHNLRWEQRTKTDKSERSFWLTDEQKAYFENLKREQDERRKDPDYNNKWREFVCVRSNGDIISPWYLSSQFPKITVKCGLPRLKLHEMRHTVISLLILKGFGLKEVSDYAGHNNISMTADTYGNLPSMNSKRLAATMGNIFSFSPTTDSNLSAVNMTGFSNPAQK